MGPSIITKIGCCGVKFGNEHHLEALDPALSLVFVKNNQKNTFVSFKGRYK